MCRGQDAVFGTAYDGHIKTMIRSGKSASETILQGDMGSEMDEIDQAIKSLNGQQGHNTDTPQEDEEAEAAAVCSETTTVELTHILTKEQINNDTGNALPSYLVQAQKLVDQWAPIK